MSVRNSSGVNGAAAKAQGQLQTLGFARGVPPAQISLAWLLSRPAATAPIFGATKPHHIDDAVAAAELELTAEELATMEMPYRPRGWRCRTTPEACTDGGGGLGVGFRRL